VPADELVGTEFLQVVRFGLRSPDDPLILDSIRVVDALLKTETPCGPVWHRYNGDGYGEHDDGSPYDGNSRGRGWPLLTGERGHYELAAGRDLPTLSRRNDGDGEPRGHAAGAGLGRRAARVGIPSSSS
jgi:glucoamylase